MVNFKKISVHDTPELSPGFLLWHVSTAWRSRIEATLKTVGLTHPQFVVLATLGWLTRKGSRVTQIAIGKMAGLDPNTTSQIIRGLEQKRLVEREPSSDSRAKNPFLTTDGVKVLTKALPLVETTDARFFQSLSQRELNFALKLFEKLRPIQSSSLQ